MGWIKNIVNKLNPSQHDIYLEEGEVKSTTAPVYTITAAYEKLEVVNRGVNLVVDSVSEIKVDIKDRINSLSEGSVDVRSKKLDILLNRKPNPYIDALTFKRNIFMDLMLDGNAFIYFDGAWLHQLPADRVEIIVDEVTYINSYKYQQIEYSPDEIIHIKDNSAKSIFRGDSRLKSTLNSIQVLAAMENYQLKYFQNNTILGVVLKTPNALSQKVKDRYINVFMQQYTASNGKRPLLLDGDMTIESLGNDRFRELDFQNSSTGQEEQILMALGVPPILLNSGNNANITPNLKMFYLNTVLPIFNLYVHQLEYFFGYDLKPITEDIQALQPEMKDKGAYYSGLVNNGIMTQNEARERLRLEKSTDEGADSLIKPSNIAGSATDSNQGGAPKKDPKKEPEK